MLANRVRKNARHLKRWATRTGVSCYRLYDRDIPEVPLAIDWYEGRLHVAEYAREKYEALSPDAHAEWLDALVAAAAAALDVAPERCFVKRRDRQRGARQYQRQGADGARFEVREGGLKFLVNLSDYLDTGLFLDHRPLRARVRAESAGARVLNLFAYTGAFTVYAAAGGAAFTATVDMSPTYLAWARENLELNGFAADPRQHRFVRADVGAFMADAARDREQWDVVVCDPPTFSNSKKLDGAFDVQREHAELLARALDVTRPGGVVYFSTNFRKFRLDEPALVRAGASIGEITASTIPEDFRDRRIHRCWRLERTP